MRKIRMLSFKVVWATIFTTLLILVTPISAVDYTVGVKVGDWVKYGDFHASVTGSISGMSSIAQMNDIDWMKMEVKSITGTEVTAETTGKYKNGTTTPSTPASKINVATGSGSSGFFVFLIGGDLKEGDNILPQQTSPALKINGTVTRAYAGAMRSVNYLDISISPVTGTTVTAKWYWDKATGVMVETFTSMSTTTPTAASMEISLKAVETNMWSADVLGTISSNPLYIIGIVAVVVVIIGVGVFMLRRRKPTTPTTPTPTPPVAEGKTE